MAKILICGMTPSTARRYFVVRAEIDLIIERINKTGHWLSEFEKVKPDGLCKTLTGVGRLIIQGMIQIQDYLENEFVSVEKIRAKADELTKALD
jgi:hypothetical protein